MNNRENARFKLSGLLIDNLSFDEILNIVKQSIDNNGDITLTGVNAGKLIQIIEDSELRKYVESNSTIHADGQAVIFASQILGQPLKERVAGIDLIAPIVTIAKEKGVKIFFLGAKQEVVEMVVQKQIEIYGNEVIAGFRNGYFDHNNSEEVAKEIVQSGAKILFIGMTSPLQEKFMYDNKDILKPVNFKMGVGGSFDVISGRLKRAPVWMQNSGLEWFFRLIQEPNRMWKRYLIGNSKFIALVLKEKFSFK